MNSILVYFSCLILCIEIIHYSDGDLNMKCYDCNSRGVHNPSPNQLCPANGTITGRFAEYPDDTCASFCMMSIRQNFMGDVIRGCYTIYPEVPWYTIRPGDCLMFEGNMYCACMGNLCNNWNMVRRVQEFVDKYDWK